MDLNYYGDKISDNMTITPEGYLLCANVSIGRTGTMEYYGQELPPAFNEPYGKIVKVTRSPAELFSPTTIASFEGKSVTNTHPSSNLDVNTTGAIERGHVQNIRRDGDYLVGDLFVKDAGLISEIQNNLKREVSCGYECSWHKVGEGQYEQRNIVGNHVAVVPNGRAGSKVAIHDSKPENTGGNKFMGKISTSILTAMGFQQYVKDAKPEEVAEAMEAMKDAKDEEPKKETEKEAKDDDQEKENQQFKDLAEQIKALKDEIAELKKDKKDDKKPAEDAKSIMDAAEEELDGEDNEDQEDNQGEEKETKDEDKKEEDKDKGKAADAALKKFVQDMKPIIMAIPDEKTRLEAAKKFASTVHDARTSSNGYAQILNTTKANKKAAMDAAMHQKMNLSQAAEKACSAWNAAGEKMKGSKRA